MDFQQRYEKTKKLLNYHNQAHLLAFWRQLDAGQRRNLLGQIDQLDFAKIASWADNLVKKQAPLVVPQRIDPAPAYPPEPTTSQQRQKYEDAKTLAENLISAGKVAAFVVAGGQGTRLGFAGPKGNLPISPVKNKTLFQIFAETIAATADKYSAQLAWYIMTSELNYAETVKIFEANNYFGLEQHNVFIFRQGVLPNFSIDGKILLAEKDRIATSPNGHGGSLKALYTSKAIEDMKQRGIEYISYFQVDNPLVNIFDPLFIGLHAIDNAQMSSKAVQKTHPTEKVGNFCLIDSKVQVIEYSDLPDEQAERINQAGPLVFNLGSIAIHIINTSFVEKLNAEGFALPLHRAVKKIEYIDDKGLPVKPAEPNGVKLETFVFDALPLAEKSIILQTVRGEEFAPVKSATGPTSPDSVRQMMAERAAVWLESAGLAVPRNPAGQPGATIEIAPAFAICKQDVAQKKDHIPPIEPGDSVYLD